MTNDAKVSKVEQLTFHNGQNDYFNDCVKIIVLLLCSIKTTKLKQQLKTQVLSCLTFKY